MNVQIRSSEDFGKLVKVKRVLSGKTQRQLAHETGISQQMISLIEVGDSNSSLETMLSISKGLGFRLFISDKEE